MTTSSKTARWAKVPELIIRDDRLTCRQLRVLLALLLHKGKDSLVWPSRSTLAELTGFSENRISSITTDLEALGWLEKHGNGGRNRATRYRLKTPPNLGRDMTPPSPAKPTYQDAHSESLSDLGSCNAETLPNTDTGSLPDLGMGIEQNIGTDHLKQHTNQPAPLMSYEELMAATRGTSLKAHIALHEERMRLRQSLQGNQNGDADNVSAI